ncbi:MAG: hypothetical protein JW928_05405 [Candidatus Aureabacteria bacterium]|nr:hypothetical protein [Candidatus Auribacterota bacterium]
MNNGNHKKIAALIILLIFVVIIWHQRLPGLKTSSSEKAVEDNPFVDIKEVPLKLDHLEIPDIDSSKKSSSDTETLFWGPDPFRLQDNQPE